MPDLEKIKPSDDLRSHKFREQLRDLINNMIDEINRDNISVGAGLYCHNSPAGKLIGLDSPARVVVVKITSNATGGGKYNGRILRGGNTVSSNMTNTAMPEGLTVLGADDCLCINPAEDGQGTHRLLSGTFLVGLCSGASNGGKKLVMLTSTPLPIPQYQHMTYVGVSQNQWGFDYVRAHPLF